MDRFAHDTPALAAAGGPGGQAQAVRAGGVAVVGSARQMRRALGWLIVVGGAAVVLESAAQKLGAVDLRLQHALWGGLLAALATALGALPALFGRDSADAASIRKAERNHDAMLGFGGGVMLAACSFSLLVPALQTAQRQGAGRLGASSMVVAGLVCGAALLLVLTQVVLARLERGGQSALADGRRIAGVWLFVLAVTLHNLPEGLAIGVAFAGSDPASARALTAGIAIQDVPEGLAIALALRSVGQGRLLSTLVGAASGLGEPLAAVLGALVAGASQALLPGALAFAAGAMLFVIVHDLVPESHRRGHATAATAALVGGFALMLLLDTVLG